MPTRRMIMTTNETTRPAPAVRYLILDGRPWFIATDLARTLGLTNGPQWARPLPASESRTVEVQTGGAPLHVRIINLSGFLKLAFASTADAARALRGRITMDDLQSGDPRRLLPQCELIPWDGKTQRLSATATAQGLGGCH
jgi:prophage antirepressor-like protein